MGLKDELIRDNEQSLLQTVMENGKRLATPTLNQIRQRTAASVASLPDSVRQISNPDPFSVNISSALESLRQSVSKVLAIN